MRRFPFFIWRFYITQVSKVVNTRHLIQKASKTRAGRRPDFVRRTMRATSKRRLAMAVSETEGITGYGHISSVLRWRLLQHGVEGGGVVAGQQDVVVADGVGEEIGGVAGIV